MGLVSSEILENSVRTYSGELCKTVAQRRPGKQKHFATDAQGKGKKIDTLLHLVAVTASSVRFYRFSRIGGTRLAIAG